MRLRHRRWRTGSGLARSSKAKVLTSPGLESGVEGSQTGVRRPPHRAEESRKESSRMMLLRATQRDHPLWEVLVHSAGCPIGRAVEIKKARGLTRLAGVAGNPRVKQRSAQLCETWSGVGLTSASWSIAHESRWQTTKPPHPLTNPQGLRDMTRLVSEKIIAASEPQPRVVGDGCQWLPLAGRGTGSLRSLPRTIECSGRSNLKGIRWRGTPLSPDATPARNPSPPPPSYGSGLFVSIIHLNTCDRRISVNTFLLLKSSK